MVDEISAPPAAQTGWIRNVNNTMYPMHQPISAMEQEGLEKDGQDKVDCSDLSYSEAFPSENCGCRLNDWPFALIFLVVLTGFIAVAALSLKDWVRSDLQMQSGINFKVDTIASGTSTMFPLIFSVILALGFASMGFGLYSCFPAFFVYCGMIVNLLAGVGAAIVFLVKGLWILAIIVTIITLIGAWYYWCTRYRIPFSIAVLKTVVGSIRQMPQVFLVSMIGCMVITSFSIIFSAVIIAVWIKYNKEFCDLEDGNCSSPELFGILSLTIFCGFYISEVIKNIIHCTVSGVFGCWYYGSRLGQKKPRWPAMGSFKRATIHSFGSICFGSLVVSVIETIHQISKLITESLRLNGEIGGCGSVGLFVVDFIVSSLEVLARYFNHYAYCFIALYGKPYVKAAKATWTLWKEKGFDALINDNLVNISLGLYSLFAGYMSTLIFYLYLQFISPGHSGSKTFNIYLIIMTFFITMQICNVINETIRSGVAVFFVTLAINPEILHEDNPQRFEEIFRYYPNILEKINYQNV